jgi:hypothetical protein
VFESKRKRSKWARFAAGTLLAGAATGIGAATVLTGGGVLAGAGIVGLTGATIGTGCTVGAGAGMLAISKTLKKYHVKNWTKYTFKASKDGDKVYVMLEKVTKIQSDGQLDYAAPQYARLTKITYPKDGKARLKLEGLDGRMCPRNIYYNAKRSEILKFGGNALLIKFVDNELQNDKNDFTMNNNPFEEFLKEMTSKITTGTLKYNKPATHTFKTAAGVTFKNNFRELLKVTPAAVLKV